MITTIRFLGCFIRICGTSRSLHNSAGRAGNTGPQIGALLGDGSSDGRALHLTLGIHNHASVVLEVDEDTILPSEGLPLTDDYGGSHCSKRIHIIRQDCMKDVCGW